MTRRACNAGRAAGPLVAVALLCVALEARAQVAIRYVYDAAGQLVQAIHVDGTTVTYDYDPLGNLLRRLVTRPGDPTGTVTGIHPDALLPATEASFVVFGVGLATATAVTFDAPELTATLHGIPQNNALEVLVRATATAAPGPHTFTVHRAALPPIASGGVVLNVTAKPTLVQVAPAQVLTGQTVEQFTLTGARLHLAPTLVFDRPGFTVTNVTASPDGTSLTARLQVALTAAAGPVGVRVATSEGTTKKVALDVVRSLSGLTGSYFDGVFSLDGSDVPVLPAASPSFIRSDPALQFGTSTNFAFRPCMSGSAGCLTGAYSVRWHGYIFLDSAGPYTFALNSSDASRLTIANAVVVNNPGTHGATMVQGMFNAPAAGSYPVVVLFNTTGKTPGIDLLYQSPSASALSLVPGSLLWGDGSVFDPVLTSAAAAVSFTNPAPPADPGVLASVRTAAVTISFFNPAAVGTPGLGPLVEATTAAVSFVSPGAVTEPGAGALIASTSTSISFSNPLSTPSPGAGESISVARGAVGFAAGPVLHTLSPRQLSRGAGGGVLTITGSNLHAASAVLFENIAGVTASAPTVSPDGRTITVTVSIDVATPIGFAGVKVSTPHGVTAAVLLEIVP